MVSKHDTRDRTASRERHLKGVSLHLARNWAGDGETRLRVVGTRRQDQGGTTSTLLVSSHLMSELEGTADHLIVIGRGRLIADAGVRDLLDGATGARVTVRTPEAAEVMAVLARAGATVTSTDVDTLTVAGLDAARIGDLAAEQGLRLYELSPQRASLEEAFFDLTQDAVEYSAGGSEEGE